MALISSFWRTLKAGHHSQRKMNLALGLTLMALIFGMLNYLAARHYVRTDWTSHQIFSLSPKTIAILKGLKANVRVTVCMVPPQKHFASLYPETRQLLQRFSRYSTKIAIEYIDLDTNPARAELLTKQFGINPAELKEGVVVFQSGEHHKYVSSASMADIEVTAQGKQRIVAFRGEAAFLEALLTVTEGSKSLVCFSIDHDEIPIDTYQDLGYGFLVDEIRRDVYDVKAIDSNALQAGSRGCQVLVISEPQRAFADVEIEALENFLHKKGRLFLLLGPVLDRQITHFNKTGLEALLKKQGVMLLDNIVLDVLSIPGETPLYTWATRDGYGDHPISRTLYGKLTVWPLVREVRARPRLPNGVIATTLVSTSEKGWAETDLTALRSQKPLAYDPLVDTAGPVSVAVALEKNDGSRLVVFGSGRGLLNRRLGLKVTHYNRDLFMNALAWLADKQLRVALGPKTPEHIQLFLDDRQLSRVFLISVLGLPALCLSIGLYVWWRRRR